MTALASPGSLALSAAGTRLFVGYGYESGLEKISVFGTAARTVVTTIDLGHPNSYAGTSPLAMSHDGITLYAGRYPDGPLNERFFVRFPLLFPWQGPSNAPSPN